MNRLIKANYEDIVNIADAVRNKTDSTDKMSYDEIIDKINKIEIKLNLQNKTITPTASIQTIVADEEYNGLSNVIINTDNNLIPENIVNGVTIFGVEGNARDSKDIEDEIVTRSITNYTNSRITSIGNSAFYGHSNLTSVNFPLATSIGSCAFAHCSNLVAIDIPEISTLDEQVFAYCSSLTTASFPKVTVIGDATFAYCTNLTSVNLPMVTTIRHTMMYGGLFQGCKNLISVNLPMVSSVPYYAFYGCLKLPSINLPMVSGIEQSTFENCSSLTTASFPKATFIESSAFRYCLNLKSLYLTGSSLCTLSNSNAFTSTPIGGYSTSAGTYGSIYVPASLLNSYKTATNWTYFSSRFIGV